MIYKTEIFNHLTKIILAIFLCLCYNVNSQALIPRAESAFESQLPFNTAYIKEQNIKSITFNIIDKKDFQVAEDNGLLTFYEFNTEGLLSRYYFTSVLKIIQKEYRREAVYRRKRKISNGYTYSKNEYVYDTVSTNYFYDAANLIKLKRFNDGSYYEGKYYTYSPEGKLINEKRCKETNVSETKTDFKLGSQTVISEESFDYLPTGKQQFKQICKNDEGRTYKEIIYNYSNSNQLLSLNELYTATWISQNSDFTYNAKGQLTSANYKSNSNGDLELARTYEYDEKDCLLTEKQFKNGMLLKEISYVTDETKKLNSYIIRDFIDKTIRIVKLIYH